MRKLRQRRTAESSVKSSSDDSDHQNTMSIIDRMSKNLLTSGGHTSRSRALRSSRSTEKKEQVKPKIKKKTTSTPSVRVTRTRSTTRKEIPYEGDIDSTTSTASSDGSTDMYDFEQSDEEKLCLVLFPSPTKKMDKKVRPLVKKSQSLRQSTLNSEALKKKSPQHGAVLKVRKDNLKQTKSTPAPKPSKGNKRKQTPSHDTAPKTKKGAKENLKTIDKSSNSSMFDSGVFMSPIERVPDTSMNTPNLTPIPTPSLSMTEASTHHIPSLQFDSLLEDPLTLSPVKSSVTRSAPVPMDLASPPRLKTPIAEKTYAHRGQFLSPSEKLEKKKKSSGKPRRTNKRVEAWATQMNAEFDEIEMYDLSIEDQ